MNQKTRAAFFDELAAMGVYVEDDEEESPLRAHRFIVTMVA